jgi:calcineurin-like phosphoesterase family protein
VNRAAAVLGPDDELWHLGDVALGYLDSSLTNLARIPADVTLVAGNHDRCHPYNGKRGERFVEASRERCQLRDLVLANTRLTLANGVEVQVSHFPFAETEAVATSRPDKFAQWRPVDDGAVVSCRHLPGQVRVPVAGRKLVQAHHRPTVTRPHATSAAR